MTEVVAVIIVLVVDGHVSEDGNDAVAIPQLLVSSVEAVDKIGRPADYSVTETV
jgi:hypothetical protein